jgi:GDP-L-fucose synthase
MNINMKNILVTGANGMLGTALGNEINNNGLNFIPITRGLHGDLTDSNNSYLVKSTITDNNVDSLIHTSAKVGGVKANMLDNESFFKENIAMNNNILNVAFENDIKNFVSILSTCIFPNENITYPLTADQLDNGKPHPSNSGYSYAKRLLYYQTKMYREFTNNNWISIVPTNIYGNNDNYNLENSHLIPALIRKAYESSISGDKFYVWGDGTPLRQFLYSEDLSKIILYAMENWNSDKPFMAVNPIEYSIKDVATIIADRFGIIDRLEYQTDKPKGQFRKPASTNVPSDFEFTSLETGLNKSIDWFIANYDTCRK